MEGYTMNFMTNQNFTNDDPVRAWVEESTIEYLKMEMAEACERLQEVLEKDQLYGLSFDAVDQADVKTASSLSKEWAKASDDERKRFLRDEGLVRASTITVLANDYDETSSERSKPFSVARLAESLVSARYAPCQESGWRETDKNGDLLERLEKNCVFDVGTLNYYRVRTLQTNAEAYIEEPYDPEGVGNNGESTTSVVEVAEHVVNQARLQQEEIMLFSAYYNFFLPEYSNSEELYDLRVEYSVEVQSKRKQEGMSHKEYGEIIGRKSWYIQVIENLEHFPSFDEFRALELHWLRVEMDHQTNEEEDDV
jgi:hypothetical protein